MKSDILEQIIARKREEIATLKHAEMDDYSIVDRRDFDNALRRPGIAVIAEVKRRSPSRGDIAPSVDPFLLAAAYEAGGAAAISCLTDESFFGAHADDLPDARRGSSVPVLRKDFIIDKRQIHQSAEMGADAILLIARCLTTQELRHLISTANRRQLATLVEAHDDCDIAKALDAGATIVGINNRNLKTFEVNIANAIRLRDRIPADCLAVSESGIHSADDVRRMADAGFDAVLVGESLVRSDNPTHALEVLRGIRPQKNRAGDAA